MIKLMPFHLDIIDVHGSDIMYALLFCMFLFCSPSPDRNCAHQFFYVFKCYRTENCPRKRLAVAFGYSVNCMISVSSDAVPVRGSLPRSTSFFQFESFMWSSMTSLQCDVDIPLVLLEISFNGAQSISTISPSICRPPSMQLGEYLVRQGSWCPWIWTSTIPKTRCRPPEIC